MSSSTVIPREQLSAYQRWELHAFDAFDATDGFGTPVRAANEAEGDARLESIRREAYAKGHADGLCAGTQKNQDEARQLRDLLTAAEQQRRDINQQFADDVLHLALTLARQMVRRALVVQTDLIVPLIKDALLQLSGMETPPTLILHPDDAAVVRTRLADVMAAGHWKIIEDATLRRGGCLLQTAASQLDATVETRWRHLTATLGMDDRWLD